MPRRRNSYFSYLDQEALSRISGEPLLSKFSMEGSVSGHHRSPHKGASVEFAEYREYTPGEDPKRMDWKVFGRSDRYYLKEFEAETNLRCHLAIDCSASMSFGEPVNKLEYAKKLTATLAYIYLGQGDAVGLHTLQKRNQKIIPTKRNPAQVQEILQVLGPLKAKGKTNLVQSLHEIAESSRTRAFVVVISDFFEELGSIKHAITHLRDRKHDVVLFQLLDKQEIEFTFDRPTRFVDLEGEGSIITEPTLIKEEYLKRLEEHSMAINEHCLECEASFNRVSTTQSISETLNSFSSHRRGISS
ncbi:MAG: DUF58 domain-containing protein [Opitutae bacterium]|jgi:uncharacterized protein (DUF58 family)|nr:DUF58 domain-containing protein [Opitutae bacterium]